MLLHGVFRRSLSDGKMQIATKNALCKNAGALFLSVGEIWQTICFARFFHTVAMFFVLLGCIGSHFFSILASGRFDVVFLHHNVYVRAFNKLQ